MIAAIMFSAASATTVVTDDVQIVLEAGELSIEFFGANRFEFNNVTISQIVGSGTGVWTETANVVPDFTLTDARGTNTGWHVNFKCDDLVNLVFSLDLGYHKSATALSVVSGQGLGGTGNGPELEGVDVTDMNSDTLCINTAAGYGKGVYRMDCASADFDIPLPLSQAIIGTYSGVFTATILDGPGGSGGWTGNVN